MDNLYLSLICSNLFKKMRIHMIKIVSGLRCKIESRKLLLLTLLPVILMVISLTLGRYGVPLGDILRLFSDRMLGTDHGLPGVLNTVIFEVRLPRIITALAIGGSLAVAGSSYQGIFNNPLVSPDILGVSAGAGFGAAMAILLSLSITAIQIASFVTGLLAVAATYIIAAKTKSHHQVLAMVLIGMLVGTVFTSCISLIKFMADPFDKLPAITFWLMGSLATVTNKDIAMVMPPVILGLIPLYLLRWQINVLSFGDEEAQTLGVDTKKTRFAVILCSTLITAASVAVSGVIGWVGLVVPHIARNIVGPNFRDLIPASFVLGGSYLLIVDTVARVLLPMEIPLGILTSLIGAPFFVWILYFRRGLR